MTYTTDNRLATYNGDLISYDADGNMAIGPLDGTTVNYSYDSRNRLTSAGSLSYQYDAEDHRISVQDSGSGSTTYIINPSTLSQVLVSTDPQGNETYYVYGLGLIGQENPDGSYQSYHYDLRGSTAALTNQLGQVTDTFEYGPYGEFSTRTGTTQTTFLYNGRDGVMTDSNGLYYMRARYYNPEIKRFINQDILLGEIPDSQSLNRYAYVNGQPISSIDPFGLSTWSDIKAIPGTISEGVSGGVRVVKEETIPYLKSDEAKTAYKQTAAAVAVAQINIAVQGAGAARFGRCAAKGPGNLVGSLNGLTSAERTVVNDLLQAGRNVQIVPRSPNAKTVDFLVNGVKTELKTLQNPNVNTAITRIKDGFKQGAECVIIDARGTGLTAAQEASILQRAAGTYPGKTLPGKVEIWR